MGLGLDAAAVVAAAVAALGPRPKSTSLRVRPGKDVGAMGYRGARGGEKTDSDTPSPCLSGYRVGS